MVLYMCLNFRHIYTFTGLYIWLSVCIFLYLLFSLFVNNYAPMFLPYLWFLHYMSLKSTWLHNNTLSGIISFRGLKILSFLSRPWYLYSMVAPKVLHVWRTKESERIKLEDAIDINKCLKQMKSTFSLHTLVLPTWIRVQPSR